MNEIASGSEPGRQSLERVLQNVSKQASLTFRQERRDVRMWILSEH